MAVIQVHQATNPQIDWLVAQEESVDVCVSIINGRPVVVTAADGKPFCPTRNGGFAEQIIVREGILLDEDGRDWVAEHPDMPMAVPATDPSRFGAGLRCFLMARVGEEAEVPAELA